MLTPDVTAIIICHDVRAEVLACLAALRAHASPLRLEIVVADNASSDGTIEAVARAYSECQTVRLSRNEGLPARNHGLRRAPLCHGFGVTSGERGTVER
jgi:GT2 family glycosyltransferase